MILKRIPHLARLTLFCAVLTAGSARADDAAQFRPKFSRGTITVQAPGGAIRTLQVEIARSAEEVAYGLMFVQELPGTHGMLFLLPELRVQHFWMKNTLIPLDIAFLDAHGKVINVAYNTEPLSTAHIVSTEPALMVLEVKAGKAAEYGIEPGAVVGDAKALSVKE